MNTAIASALISVLGAGLLGFFIFQLRTIIGGLNRLSDQLRGLEDRFMAHLTDLQKEIHEGFKDHGERLARIEASSTTTPLTG